MDWDKYELILFNIVQNAVKYNQFMGKIIVVIDCQSITNDFTSSVTTEFVTQVIDTGIGIAQERHDFLF